MGAAPTRAVIDLHRVGTWSGATTGATRTVALNFTGLDYMNSGGIGLLVPPTGRSSASSPFA